MERWLAIILSGMFVYWLLAREPRRSARVSIWLLLLILMIPPLFTVGFMEIYRIVPPLSITLPLWLGSAGLYLWLNRPGAVAVSPNKNSTPGDPQPVPPVPSQPITPEEEGQLRQCFSWSTYLLEAIEYRPQGIVCRGKLREQPEVAYQAIQERVQASFGDRFFLLLQAGFGDQPFFVLVPKQTSSDPNPRLFHYLLATSTWVLAWFCSCQMGAMLLEAKVVAQGWPYALMLLAALGARDGGRWLVAKYYRLRTGLIYCIPLPFFPGSCGTALRLRDPLPRRQVLFDLGLAGLALSLVVSLGGLWWGLQQSTVVSLTAKAGIFNFAACNPRFSLLLTLWSKLALGNDFRAGAAIDLHPVAIAAYLGFLLTAINFLPFKRFDGGNIVHSMYGARSNALIAQVVKFLLLILGLIQYRAGGQGGALLFAVLLTFFPALSDPTLNDVTEINNGRDGVGLLVLAIGVAIFLPVGGVLARSLGV
jgi:hypothetical protein